MTPRFSLAVEQGQTASEAAKDARIGLRVRGLEAENNEGAEMGGVCVCVRTPPQPPHRSSGKGWDPPPGWFLNGHPSTAQTRGL